MPDENMTVSEAEAALGADGRYGWLLSGRQVWDVYDVASEYERATGVRVSHDTVTRWFKRLPEGEAEKYPGTIGWRANRDALVIFFAMRKHLRQSDEQVS